MPVHLPGAIADLVSLENIGRSLTAAGFAYVAAPFVIPSSDAQFSVSRFTFGKNFTLSKGTGFALYAFLITSIVDLIQSRVIGHTQEGRLTRYPSLAVHVVGGGVLMATLPGFFAGYAFRPSAGDEGSRLFMLGAVTEIVSQFFYENYIAPHSAGQEYLF